MIYPNAGTLIFVLTKPILCVQKKRYWTNFYPSFLTLHRKRRHDGLDLEFENIFHSRQCKQTAPTKTSDMDKLSKMFLPSECIRVETCSLQKSESGSCLNTINSRSRFRKDPK